MKLPSTQILSEYADEIKLEQVYGIEIPRQQALIRQFWKQTMEFMELIPSRVSISERGLDVSVSLDEDTIKIGTPECLNQFEQSILSNLIDSLIPWRKGPFNLFGQEIDAEWRSDRKWKRIEPHLGTLEGKRIADVGCGNGYYMFRLIGALQRLGQVPDCLIGLDPSERFYLTFHLLQKYIQAPRVGFQLLGAEHMPLFPAFFDLVLCLGVIYHQKDPLQLLVNLREGMRSGAKLLLESQTIPGEESVALFAADRYAKARNVYFIPTPHCLCSWAKRAGFVDVQLVSEEKLDPSEQRRTRLAPYESLIDFLDPTDLSKTVEGFPAPYRSIIVCHKP